jgi:hypothetical protein
MTISITSLLSTTTSLANNDTEKNQKIITQEQAAILASKIANEKFQKVFGISPFTPESYPAKLVDSRWYWGKIDPAGINGCSAKVEFNKDGSDENVKVAYSTDRADPKIILEKDLQKIKILPESQLE